MLYSEKYMAKDTDRFWSGYCL